MICTSCSANSLVIEVQLTVRYPSCAKVLFLLVGSDKSGSYSKVLVFLVVTDWAVALEVWIL